MQSSFAAWVALKRRLPPTPWGDFLRLTLKSGELEEIKDLADLHHLLNRNRSEELRSAKTDWTNFRRWISANGREDPKSHSQPDAIGQTTLEGK